MDSYAGQIRLFAGNYAPVDWAFCDGRQLSINDYQLLYAVIGTVYGGDGVNNFNLPNLKGRLPVGAGQGPGLQNYALGGIGGTEAVTLTEANLPPHTHPMSASSTAASTATPGPTVTFATVASNLRFYVDTGQGTVTGTQQLNPADVGPAGGGQAHNNVMPCTPINYIICVNGLYPVH